MNFPFVASIVAGVISAGLVPVAVQSDVAVPRSAATQAISPLITGNYLIAAPGRVEPASEEIRVAAPVTGVLREVLVKEGDSIKRGQELARVENADMKARLSQANADLRLQQAALARVTNGAREAERQEAMAAVAEAAAVEKNAAIEYNRQRALGTENVASKSAVDTAERQYAVAREKHKAAVNKFSLINDPARQEDVEIAQARVDAATGTRDAAQAELDKTIIRSPIDGTVLRVLRHPGELVSIYVDDPVVAIGDLSRLYVRAEVDEADVAKLQSGLTAYVTAEAYGGQRFSGYLASIGQTLGKKSIHTDEPGERTDTKILEVLIALDMPNPLRPGLQVNTFIMPPGVAQAQTPTTE
jgi:HlyD family secretion protein